MPPYSTRSNRQSQDRRLYLTYIFLAHPLFLQKVPLPTVLKISHSFIPEPERSTRDRFLLQALRASEPQVEAIEDQTSAVAFS